jgi:hypothetical protein
MSSLYFDNNPSSDVNLKKAEILVYYKKGGAIDFKPVGFPPIVDDKPPIIRSKEANSDTIVVDNISSSFYPISMTMWGKDYDISNKFRMVEINDNGTNITTFEVKSDNTISLSIKIGKILSKSNTGNFGVNDTKNYLDSPRDDKTYPNLIGKVIILYDESLSPLTSSSSVKEYQSLIKNTASREMYKYIGIF